MGVDMSEQELKLKIKELELSIKELTLRVASLEKTLRRI